MLVASQMGHCQKLPLAEGNQLTLYIAWKNSAVAYRAQIQPMTNRESRRLSLQVQILKDLSFKLNFV